MWQYRTDLAVEENEKYICKNNIEVSNVQNMTSGVVSSISGVEIKETIEEEKGIYVTEIDIKNKNGEKAFNKKKGKYVTIEVRNSSKNTFGHDVNERNNKRNWRMNKEDGYSRIDVDTSLSNIVNKYLVNMTEKYKKLLVVGLGNRCITSDCLGPEVVNRIDIMGTNKIIYAIAPGVRAQTGMETAQVIKGIVRQTKPECIIAIDALAARNFNRLNNTIQLCDTGIHPGSGIGNHRQGITKETIGVPVIAIGVPTVIDGFTFILDNAGEDILTDLNSNLEEKMSVLSSMFLTTKDIDEDVFRVSDIISFAINSL